MISLLSLAGAGSFFLLSQGPWNLHAGAWPKLDLQAA